MKEMAALRRPGGILTPDVLPLINDARILGRRVPGQTSGWSLILVLGQRRSSNCVDREFSCRSSLRTTHRSGFNLS